MQLSSLLQIWPFLRPFINLAKVSLMANFLQIANDGSTVMTLSFRTDRSGQTVQTQIRLLLEEQSDQGLHCLLFHLHHFDKIPQALASLFEFSVNYSKVFRHKVFWNPKI